MAVKYGNLPFDEAIKYFRQKVNMPTKRWTDLMGAMHSRAFVVAGAERSALLSDLREAVDKAISQGTTLQEFRRAFDRTVAANGWAYKGSRGWRTRVIYQTNLSVAYAAGHHAQMTDPDVLSEFPFWRYRALDTGNRRPLHQQWKNTILPAGDPWWQTHYPPNGWGCKCWIEPLTRSQYDRLRGSAGINTTPPDDGTYQWTNPGTGETLTVPTGIDPGWDYNPGAAAWGERLSQDAMAEWKSQGAKAWETLTPQTFEAAGRPAAIPLDTPRAKRGVRLASTAAAVASLEKLLGGREKIFTFQSGSFEYAVVVNAHALGEHIDLARSQFLPWLPETLDDPFEIWASFERHKGTGKVALRQRTIKGFDDGKGKSMLVVFQAKDGLMESYTMIPTSDMKYANTQRVGKLIYARK